MSGAPQDPTAMSGAPQDPAAMRGAPQDPTAMRGAPQHPAEAGEVEGPSYPPALKLLATLLVLALLDRGARAAMAGLDLAGSALLLAGLVVVAAGWWEILRSRTAVDATAIRQRSLWPREVKRADIVQARLVRLPGLDALVVPRLVVRTRAPGWASFRAGSPALRDAFRRLARGEGPPGSFTPAAPPPARRDRAAPRRGRAMPPGGS